MCVAVVCRSGVCCCWLLFVDLWCVMLVAVVVDWCSVLVVCCWLCGVGCCGWLLFVAC